MGSDRFVTAPIAVVHTSDGPLKLELVWYRRRRWIQLVLLQRIPGQPTKARTIRVRLNEWRAFANLFKRLPGAVREMSARDVAPEPRAGHAVDALVDRVHALRAGGLDKATASARALSETLTGGGRHD